MCFSLTWEFPSSLENLDQETFSQRAAPLPRQLHSGCSGRLTLSTCRCWNVGGVVTVCTELFSSIVCFSRYEPVGTIICSRVGPSVAALLPRLFPVWQVSCGVKSTGLNSFKMDVAHGSFYKFIQQTCCIGGGWRLLLLALQQFLLIKQLQQCLIHYNQFVRSLMKSMYMMYKMICL